MGLLAKATARPFIRMACRHSGFTDYYCKLRSFSGQAQALSSQCQNIQSGVEIAVHDQPTGATLIDAIRQGQVRFASATSRATLRRIRGIHCHEPSVGACLLPGDQGCELTPRNIVDALGETFVLDHLLEGESFNNDQIEHSDDAMRMLVREIFSLPFRPFMRPSYHLAQLLPMSPGNSLLLFLAHSMPDTLLIQIRVVSLDPLGHFFSFGFVDAQSGLMLPLCSGKRLFLAVKETRVRNFLSVCESGKCL
jgi:hypothetical protein